MEMECQALAMGLDLVVQVDATLATVLAEDAGELVAMCLAASDAAAAMQMQLMHLE